METIAVIYFIPFLGMSLLILASDIIGAYSMRVKAPHQWFEGITVAIRQGAEK